jgi:hypothetical protein
LIEEWIFKTLFINYIKEKKINLTAKNVAITSSSLYTSVISGQKSKNKNEIIEELGIQKLSIYTSDMDKYSIKLNFDEEELTINLIDKMKEYIENNAF